MIKRKSKLRLRKQVIIAFPIAIIIAIVAFVYIVNQNTTLAEEVTKNNDIKTNIEIPEIDPNAPVEKTILSNNKYIQELENKIRISEKNKLIEYYANAYKINVDKAIEIARRNTYDYTSEAFVNYHVIPGENGRWPKINNIVSEETGIMYYVKDLYTYPERYGSSFAEIRLIETPYTARRYDSNGNIIMMDGTTFEQFVGKICDLYGIDKATVLAISYHEAGVKTSNLFVNSNNIGGHKGYNGWQKFVTLEAGVIGHVIAVRNIAAQAGADISTADGLYAFSSVYVNGHVGNPSYHWYEKVSYFKNQINSKDLFTIK